MADVEIHCQKHPEMKLTIVGELSNTDLRTIQFQAQEIYYECGKHHPEGCSVGCAVPKVGQANLAAIRQAIAEVLKGQAPSLPDGKL